DLLAPPNPDRHDRDAEPGREVGAAVEEVGDLATVPPRALRKDRHRLAAFECFLRGAQRGAVGASPLDGEAAQRGEQPGKERLLEQLLLGHEADAAARGVPGEEDVHERTVRRRHHECALARHLLASAYAYQEDRLERREDERPDDPVQDPLAEIAPAGGSHGSAPTAASKRSTTSLTTSSTSRPVVSITTASGAGARGVVRLSSVSRRSTASRTDSKSAGRAASSSSRWRRRARSPSSAVRKTLTGASVNTTVPMSRPSMTPPPRCSAHSRCRSRNSARTAGWEDTSDPPADTAGPRISALTSRPSSRTLPGGSPSSRTASSAARAIASPSPRSRPRSMARSVTARYIAPVSSTSRPRAEATPRATVDLPDPAGPSMATTWITTRSRPS